MIVINIHCVFIFDEMIFSKTKIKQKLTSSS